MSRKSCFQLTKVLVLSGAIAGASVLALSYPYAPAHAADDDFTAPDATPTVPAPANSETVESAKKVLPGNTPPYFKKIYSHFLKQPLPSKIFDQGGIPAVIPKLEIDNDPSGQIGSYQPDGRTITKDNAFFQSLGENGRSCVTCHQPSSGMSISLRNILKRLDRTKGKDPLYAPVDGANCPSLVPAADTSGSLIGGFKGKSKKDFMAARSLLLTKGLIRIPMPMPPNADFKVRIISDPSTCNTDPVESKADDGTPIFSMFRRPLMSAALHFKTASIFPPPPPNPPVAGQEPFVTGNIMWDGREPTLHSQAISATLGHAQALKPPSEEEIQEIIDFEMGIFSAQYSDKQAGVLSANGGKGGPVNFSDHDGEAPAFPPPPANPNDPPNPFIAFTEYDGWAVASGSGSAKRERESIARGQALFNGVAKDAQGNTRGGFIINGVAGFNDLVGPNAAGTCATCHNFSHAGSDILPFAQRDIGIGGQGSEKTGATKPKPDLPIFEVYDCKPGSFLWDATATSTRTNDIGRALITGKCKDVGVSTVPALRGISSHEPFFRDGSAQTSLNVVDHYNTRFSIGLTTTEKQDLVNFLSSL